MTYPYWQQDDKKDAEEGRHYGHVKAYSDAICLKAWEIRQQNEFVKRQIAAYSEQAARNPAKVHQSPASAPLFSSDIQEHHFCHGCETFRDWTDHLGFCTFCSTVVRDRSSVAVLVTPPLSPMGGNIRPKSLKKWADDWRQSNAD